MGVDANLLFPGEKFVNETAKAVRSKGGRGNSAALLCFIRLTLTMAQTVLSCSLSSTTITMNRHELGLITHETSNGCTYTREELIQIGIAITHDKKYRRIYCLTEFDRKEFPWASFRVEVTNGLPQTDWMFTTVPCAVKKFGNGEECKNRLIWQTSDDLPIETIVGHVHEKFSNWEYWI
jgi:hypothetical protein